MSAHRPSTYHVLHPITGKLSLPMSQDTVADAALRISRQEDGCPVEVYVQVPPDGPRLLLTCQAKVEQAIVSRPAPLSTR